MLLNLTEAKDEAGVKGIRVNRAFRWLQLYIKLC